MDKTITANWPAVYHQKWKPITEGQVTLVHIYSFVLLFELEIFIEKALAAKVLAATIDVPVFLYFGRFCFISKLAVL